jgi:hypothetical protein
MCSEESSFSAEVRHVLSTAGWAADRDLSKQLEVWTRELGAEFKAFPAVREALRKYGGLVVNQSGPGEECARETFELDPLLAIGEGDRFRDHAERLGTELYPLGEAGNGHVFLAMSPDGRVFALMEDVWLLGQSLENAIESLVRGRNLKRI